MLQIDWGNIALAFAALGGFLGWVGYFGLATAWNSPPAGEPSTDEPELTFDYPGSR